VSRRRWESGLAGWWPGEPEGVLGHHVSDEMCLMLGPVGALLADEFRLDSALVPQVPSHVLHVQVCLPAEGAAENAPF
jgi:hypothetical protein